MRQPTVLHQRVLAHARAQGGMVTRDQLRALGVDSSQVRNQVAAERWVERTSTVVSVFTGEPTWQQRVWCGVLHVGDGALVGGLTALACHGLKRWDRDAITVLAPMENHLDDVPDDLDLVRTRRKLDGWRVSGRALPLARVEPAVLLFAGYERSGRTALGALAACVQQRLTTPERLAGELELLRPLRRAATFRKTLAELAGGAQSLAELDVGRMCRRFNLPMPDRQTKRRDSAGRVRFTDCEWDLLDGRTLVLEVDGGFHMEVEHWEDDLARQRRITSPTRTVVRCSAREVRDEPGMVAADLRALGLAESCG